MTELNLIELFDPTVLGALHLLVGEVVVQQRAGEDEDLVLHGVVGELEHVVVGVGEDLGFDSHGPPAADMRHEPSHGFDARL